jgi:trehalose 6-phosphate phosphatase
VINLLSPDGEDALRNLIEADPMFGFDFDGTLSPTEMLPERAHMSQGVFRGFRALCATAPVAVITGRNVKDIAARLPVRPKYLIGDFGVEGIPGQEKNLSEYRDICEHWMDQIMHDLHWEQIDPGLRIEHNAYSVCVHYRFARDRERVAREVDATLAQLDPAPIVIAGKCGINLLPQGAPTKRVALERLLMHEGKRAAFYIGDDDTDEVVFRHAPRDWVTVKVGRDRNSAARFFLHHQNEMTECLQLMVKLLKQFHSQARVATR